MKGGAAGATVSHPIDFRNIIAYLHDPDRIPFFMKDKIYHLWKTKIGDTLDLDNCVEKIKENERLQTVLCYISLKPVEHLTDKLELLKKMALAVEKEMVEHGLKLSHRDDHDTRKEFLAEYVRKEELIKGLSPERKYDLRLLKVISYLSEWALHVLELLLDDKMAEIKEEIKKEKEKLSGEMTELQRKATETAHELGAKGHKLLDGIHVEDHVTHLKEKSATIKEQLEAKGVSEVLVTELFAKVQKDISGGVHDTLDDKLHIIEREGKVLEGILRKELEKANKKANKNTEEIEAEVALLMTDVKEHVVALHIHERLHMPHKIGIEIFMILLSRIYL